MQTSPKVRSDVETMNPDLARVNFREWPQRLGLVSLRVDERAVWKRCIIAFLGDSKARGRVVCRANAREFWREQREKGASVNLEAFAAALDWFCGCGVRRGKSGNAKVESGKWKWEWDGRWERADGGRGDWKWRQRDRAWWSSYSSSFSNRGKFRARARFRGRGFHFPSYSPSDGRGEAGDGFRQDGGEA